jgi:hypothetical protein
MNTKKIVFSSIITSLVGLGFGLVLLNMNPYPDRSKTSLSLRHTYLLISGVAGLLIGSSLEAVRQLKEQQDEDEALANQFRQAKAAFPQFNIDPAFLPPEEN